MRHGSIRLLLLTGLLAARAKNVIQVDGEYRHTGDAAVDKPFQRNRELAARYNRRHHHVILAPLEGRSVITKERMYVNAKEEKDDEIYEKLMTNTKVSLDSFFVTAPPIRTKMPEREETTVVVTTTEPTHLRLVTLPKLAKTTPPPFKYVSKAPREQKPIALASVQAPQYDVGNSAVVRFPAQPWQIPPKEPQRPFNPWQNLFEPPKLLQPANPFLPLAANTTNPFIPIGVSQPAPFNPFPTYPPTLQPPPAPFEVPLAHKSPLRNSGFAKNAQLTPIPLPSDPFSYNNEQRVLKSLLEPDYSIDSQPVSFTKDEVYKSGARTFVTSRNQRPAIEGGSSQLKNFAMTHPNIMSSVKMPTMKESQLVLPKSLQNQRSIIPVTPATTASLSSLTPNQKLYLCCQKQQLSTSCQGMCNFDTFSDKSLVSAFLTNQCPGPQLGKAYDCASSKADHTACCERNGLNTIQGGRCMPFCRTHVATPSNVLDYFPCLQVFETIKYCYREYQLSNKNIFGD